MPRRARPGDRGRIEAALSPTLRVALGELRELLDLDDWQRSCLGPPFQQAGTLLRAAEIIRHDGVGEADAISRAAAELGLAPETIRTRGSRWPLESRPPGVRYEPDARSALGAIVEANGNDSASEGGA